MCSDLLILPDLPDIVLSNVHDQNSRLNIGKIIMDQLIQWRYRTGMNLASGRLASFLEPTFFIITMCSESMISFCQLYLLLSTNLIFTMQEENSDVLQNHRLKKGIYIIFKDQCLKWERSHKHISTFLLSLESPSPHTVIELSWSYFNRFRDNMIILSDIQVHPIPTKKKSIDYRY